MSKPISIDFSADTRSVIRETDNLADAFDDVSGSLKDLARDSERAADKVEDGARDARGDVEKLETALDGAGDGAKGFQSKVDAAFDSIADDARNASRKVADDTKDGFRQASEATDQLREDSFSNAKEVAASFDGSASSIAEGFQGAAAEALSGFGPLGAAAGLALAAGLGMAMAALQGEADRVNELGEAVAEFAGEIRDAGGDIANVDFDQKMADWGLSIQDTREWWEIFQADAQTGLEKISELAGRAGIDFKDAFRGSAGDLDDAKDALGRVDAAMEAVRDRATYTTDAVSGMSTMDFTSSDQLDALEELRDGIQENISTQERAVEQNELLADAGVRTAEAIEAEEEALEAANEELEAHAQKLQDASGAALDAESASLDYAAQLEATKATLAENGETVDINTEAGRNNRQALLDQATAALEVEAAMIANGSSTGDVTAKTKAAREAFILAADAAGYTRDEARDLATKYGLIPANVDTKVQAHNVQQTKDEIDGVAKPRTAVVNVEKGCSYVLDSYINGLNQTKVFIDVVQRLGQDNK